MSQVVLVHGIGKQVQGPETLLAQVYPALADGLALAGAKVDRAEVAMAFYGDLFRQDGHRDVGEPELDASDVAEDIEEDLLTVWWHEAAEVETAVPKPQSRTRGRTPYQIQRALDALSHATFFAGIGERMLILGARQVRRYFTELDIREAARARLAACVDERTRVIVAHSLGSIVSYEALCAHPEWDVDLVTLGSPLGVRNIVFDRLVPRPEGDRGHCPVSRWTNIADLGDIVALVKRLSPLFGPDVTDLLVHNGAKAHDARPYLTSREAGLAVAEALV